MKLPLAVVSFVASLFLVANAQSGLPAYTPNGGALPSLAPMLEQVNPAVVNIATYTQREAHNPLLNDPFFRHFFDVPERGRSRPQQRQRSAGSGVIVSAADGTVITNHHVIRGADEIQVILNDGRTYAAELVGSDPEVDIAVLRIDAKNLTELPMSDSNTLRVGDFVVAIGNPFGLGQTVTSGIVSALGRTGLGIEGYEDFIQTDASINPGHSGGALVNLHGELVGINTAIIAPAGGNIGIGFAIPTNMARASISQLLEHGEVRRGQLGISIQDVTPELQEAFDLEYGQQGVLVTGVADGSEAQRAGLKPGDVIIAVNGRPTLSSGALRNEIGVREIGDEVRLDLIRDGERQKITSRVGEPQGSTAGGGRSLHPLLDGARFGENPDGRGVTLVSVEENSAAAASGLEAGDIITEVNRVRVDDMQSFEKALGRSQESVLLRVQRGRGNFYLVIR